MPANRSRTERWRDCLEQIRARSGGLELTVRGDTSGEGYDLVWRVRLLDIREDSLTVERPAAAGSAFDFPVGARIVASMSIGQNRWMFHTRVLPGGGGRDRISLSSPEGVERCQRRAFFRISTAELRLPEARCWPVTDPASLPVAQAAARSSAPGGGEDRLALPIVGVPFDSTLMNVGGGGLGLLVPPQAAGAVEALQTYWISFDLGPEAGGSISVAGKLVHTHLDHAQNLYCGFSFEFGGDARHRDFVVQRLSSYIRGRKTGGEGRQAA
ncbi:MAG: hypothetical protein AAGG07_03480 [Planctomycetota bacterium]